MKKIKTITLIAVACFSFAMMSFSTTGNPLLQTTIARTIKVLWANENHDFGEIPQGKPVSVEFSFNNNGDEPILIADVATSCGCTASDYSKEPIAPGKSSAIKVIYNAATAGSFSKSITVNFSDATSKKVLMIKGTVK